MFGLLTSLLSGLATSYILQESLRASPVLNMDWTQADVGRVVYCALLALIASLLVFSMSFWQSAYTILSLGICHPTMLRARAHEQGPYLSVLGGSLGVFWWDVLPKEPSDGARFLMFLGLVPAVAAVITTWKAQYWQEVRVSWL